MGIYSGDSYTFVLSITNPDGSNPVVTAGPFIQVVNARTLATQFGSAPTMSLVTGSQKVYIYQWAIPAGATSDDYVALVSYTTTGTYGLTVTSRFLEKVRLGDTFVTGKVALDATVAKDSSVAKDVTVAHASDLAGINPNTSSVVLAIKSVTDSLPASMSTIIGDLTSIGADVTDIHDATIESCIVDLTTTPKTLTLKRHDGSNLATYNLTEDGSSTARTRTS